MLKTLLLVALSAPPALLLITGCSFSHYSSEIRETEFEAGDGLPTDVIFCDIEADRDCATPAEIAMGVDVTAPYKDGLLAHKSSKFGLDYSPDAMAACGGPKKVHFQGPFPDGTAVCLNADSAIGPGLQYADITEACVAWCDSHPWIDDDGNQYGCRYITRASVAGFFEAPVHNACTPGGTLRSDFKDLRKVAPFNVEWENLSNVALIGVGNGLRKTAVAQDWVAGATSTRLLTSGDGFVEFTATETTLRRMAGLAVGATNMGSSLNDITFAASLEEGGTLVIYEAGVQKFTYGSLYKTGDIVRVTAAGGVVRYFLNGSLVYTSTTPYSHPLRVDASLFHLGASLGNVKASF